MARALIVNADDYGLAPSVSAGIRQAHLEGLVTSTTALMNQPGVAAELARAKAECPRLGLGVHLVLTLGRPVLPPAAVPSLIGLGDGNRLPTLAQLRASHGRLDPAEVLAEWRAQVAAFVRATGRAPTHLDSHHHAAYLSAPLLSALLTLAEENGCPIRLPFAHHDPLQAHLGLPTPELSRLRAQASASPVPRPQHFEARFYGEPATPGLLRAILATLPEGVTELMCHPGLPDPSLSALTSYHTHRAQELAALTDTSLRSLTGGLQLVTFGAVAP